MPSEILRFEVLIYKRVSVDNGPDKGEAEPPRARYRFGDLGG
jgi:hypothetical protein